MLKKIKLVFGSNENSPPLELEVGSITIFVGPNNSGKSLILRDIENYCKSTKSGNIIKQLEFYLPDKEGLEKIISEMPPMDQSVTEKNLKKGRFNATKGFVEARQIEYWCQFLNNDINSFIKNFIPMFVSLLTGKARFSLVNEQQCGDLQKPPANCLMRLIQNEESRTQMREIIFGAFKKYFTIDPTNMGKLRIKLSDELPPPPNVEFSFCEASRDYYAKGKNISDFSDGVQAFVGLVTVAIAGEEKIILVDEPEAFLHPPLASSLGKKLSEIMAKREGNLIAATHSPHFLMGCLQSGKPINVVRLTYDGKYSTARLLSDEKIKVLFKDPLLRSVGVMQSLFYSSVIVTEGDADRAFYNEINERLSNDGIQDCLFLNAQNMQTIYKIIHPLREMGIPVVGIVDIDFIKNGGEEFTKMLRAVGVPNDLHNSLSTLRANLNTIFEKTDKNIKTDGGINLLKNGELETCKKFLNDLAEYGLFIVPGGELESWLQILNIEKKYHGLEWLIQVFNRIGNNPDEPSYMTPSAEDVWDFMKSIRNWVLNPDKKGIL